MSHKPKPGPRVQALLFMESRDMLEICVDNLESLHIAAEAGADRIELCSALALGGLTPSAGFMRAAAQLNIPVRAMIRPRAGDFVYSDAEIALMIEDIQQAKQAGLSGVVLGVLDNHGQVQQVQQEQLAKLVASAGGLAVTFHRAIDVCHDWQTSLEQVIAAGCDCVLTSGQASSAQNGRAVLREMMTQADGRIQIMAGAGVNADNIEQLATETGVSAFHLSGMVWTTLPAALSMGQDDDGRLNMTCAEKVRAAKTVAQRFS